MSGIVIKSTGSWYEVRTDSGETVQCRLKGILRLEETRDNNPVVVGDIVTLAREDSDWMIAAISERGNYSPLIAQISQCPPDTRC
jgi:ribosome biogenesis GTPase